MDSCTSILLQPELSSQVFALCPELPQFFNGGFVCFSEKCILITYGFEVVRYNNSFRLGGLQQGYSSF